MTILKKYWIFIALPLLVVIVSLVAIRIINSIDYHNNDFFTFWLAGHMVTLGGNPYAPVQWVAGHHEFGVTWIPNQAYVYPLPLSLLFAPLGLLPLKQAYTLWVALSELMILATLVLLLAARAGSRFGKVFLPLLVGMIFFRPTILTLFNGQISGLLLLLLTGTIFLWEKGKWEWGSLFLPLLMLKPNLGAPILALVGIWLLFQKRYKPILVIASGLLALLVIGLLQNPHWISDYWSIGNNKLVENFGGSPTVWGLGYLVCGHNSACTLAVGGIAGLLFLFAFLWLVLPRRDDISALRLVALAATVTLLITPYTWTYDQLLIVLPIVDITLALDKNGYRFTLVSSLFLGLDILVVILLILDAILNVEILNAVVPILILGLYASVGALWMRKITQPVME